MINVPAFAARRYFPVLEMQEHLIYFDIKITGGFLTYACKKIIRDFSKVNVILNREDTEAIKESSWRYLQAFIQPEILSLNCIFSRRKSNFLPAVVYN